MDRIFEVAGRLSSTAPDDVLDVKGLICCAMTGFSGEAITALHRWNRNLDPMSTVQDIVMKPQTFHSAMAIYVLLKYPQYRPKNSFVTLILNRKAEDVFLKIATDILDADVDGHRFVEASDSLMRDVTIVDDRNKTVVTSNK